MNRIFHGQVTKRILVLLITLAMLFSMLPVSAFAQDTDIAQVAEGEEDTTEEHPSLLSALFGVVDPVYIESITGTALNDANNADQVVRNDLLNFDPNQYDYNVYLKNGVITKDNFTVKATGAVTSMTYTVTQNGEVGRKETASPNTDGTQFSIYNVNIAQWGETKLTLIMNYGTSVSPRLKTYTVNFYTNTEADSTLESLEVTPYAGNTPAELLPLPAFFKDNGNYPQMLTNMSADKVIVTASPKNKGVSLSLTYRSFADDNDLLGTQKTVEIEAGVPYEITDCFSDAFSNQILTNSGYGSYTEFKLDFAITVKPQTNQQERVYTESMIRGPLSPYRLRTVSVANNGSEKRIELVQPDGTTGYSNDVRNYKVTMWDSGSGLDGAIYRNDQLVIRFERYIDGARYVEFDGQFYDLEGLENESILREVTLTSKKLEAGKRRNVELKLFRDESRKEYETITFDVGVLPSNRLIISAADENVAVGSTTGFYNLFLNNDVESGLFKFESLDKNAELTWSTGEKLELDENGCAQITAADNNRRLYVTSKATIDGDMEEQTYSTAYTLLVKTSNGQRPMNLPDYWPAPGQFTNSDEWGALPTQEDLATKNIGVSLGGFGGYVVAEFADPIVNDPKNPGGGDFKVEGNAFHGNSEPGNVLVSQDGETWYTLAGGYHYEDDCIWDYSITYQNNDPHNADTLWSDNQGNSGKIEANGYHSQPYYPLTENYGQYRTAENAKQYGGKYGDNTIPNEYTLSGVLLPGRVSSWGYADAATGAITGPIDQQINAGIYVNKQGAMSFDFDLDWAVDENGSPVDLDWVKYVKVQNATNNIVPPFGELSTEVINITKTAGARAMGRTDLAQSILINGQSIDLSNVTDEEKESGKICRTVYYGDENQSIDVQVTPPSNMGNTFATLIGNGSGTSRHYDKVPEHKMIRIVTQNNTEAGRTASQPTIYYIKLEKTDDYYGLSLDKNELPMAVGDSYELKASFTAKEPEDKSVIWESRDPSVATVDANGKVTAVSEGNTQIYVKSPSTNSTFVCQVKVGELIKNITLSQAEIKPVIGGAAISLMANFDKGVVNPKVSWSIDNPAIATLAVAKEGDGFSRYYVTAQEPGEATITVTTTNGLTATGKVIVGPREKGTAIVSVEKFTLGQGYLLEPTQVEFEKGQSAADIITKFLSDNQYEYTFTGDIATDFYLASIKNADTGELNIPEELQAMNGFNVTYTGVNKKAPALGEFAYSGQSGWIYHVNDKDPGVGMASCAVKDGDVIRLQFTLYGLGADLGVGGYGDIEALPVAQKSELSMRVADWRANASSFLTIQKYKDAYDAAIKVLTNHMSTQEEVDAAVAAMPYVEAVPVTDFTVDRDQASMVKGENIRVNTALTPTTASDTSITWTSDNENVAIVDAQGQITALDEGEAVITASPNGALLNQNSAQNGLAKTIAVTVHLTNSQAASKVDAMIATLGEVTLAKEADILAAQKAYDKLSPEAQSLVQNKEILDQAIETLDALKAPVNSLITEIAELDIDSLALTDRAKIDEIVNAYNALSNEQRGAVPDEVYHKLINADNKIKALEKAANDQDKAASVTALLNALPDEITLNLKTVIAYARDAYDNLSKEQQMLVDPDALIKLTTAEQKLAELEAQEGADAEAAKAVSDQILALGEITSLEQAGNVAAAQRAYDALTENQKKLVKSETLKVLCNAQDAISRLATEATDRLAAQNVTNQINGLGAITDAQQKPAVEAARSAYEGLTANQKVYVSDETVQVLEQAEASIKALEDQQARDQAAANAVIDQIKALEKVITLEDKATVENVRVAYNALTDAQKALVPDEVLSLLKNAEAKLTAMESNSGGNKGSGTESAEPDIAQGQVGISGTNVTTGIIADDTNSAWACMALLAAFGLIGAAIIKRRKA